MTWGDARQTAICTFFLSNSHFLSISPHPALCSSHSSPSSFFLCPAKFLLITIQSASPHSLSRLSVCTPLWGSFSFQSLFVSFLTCQPSLSVCSRLVQCEQGLSMKIFNYRPRLLDTPHLLFNSPPSLKPLPPAFHPLSHPQSPPLSTLTFLNSFCKYMFTQCKWMVSTAVKIEQTVHFTMWDY